MHPEQDGPASQPRRTQDQLRELLSVWAPNPAKITALAGDHRIELIKEPGDWWRPAAPLPEDLQHGDFDYAFLLDDDPTPLPDPRSRRQPNGVHERSRSYDPAGFGWQDQQWTGRQLAGGVIYELHLGTFSPDGTLRSAIDHLDHLVELGIDFVELMPVNAFNGDHNWGYDGVDWYAVQESYGGPAAYQEFVDACHQRGLAVIQDVVYNHLGPSGNYLPRFGPYLTTGRSTWGDLINLDGPGSDEVRRFIIDNALTWLRDYHVDGLRLDAVHALMDSRAQKLLEELAIETDTLSAQLGRPLTLIAESDLNDPKLITAPAAGGYGLAGQWSDDFHHALYVRLTGDSSGYYSDFAADGALAKVLRRGFFHDGSYSSFRGRSHGRPIDAATTAGWQLVVCSDNHDQIGNRAAGERLSTKIDFDQLRPAAVLTVLGPFTPMIFMGEEWGTRTPFQFFTSHPEPELGRIVAEGRLEEFAKMDWDTSQVPDPQDPQTFRRSKLDWTEPTRDEHAELLADYRKLIKLRRTVPELTDPRFAHISVDSDDDAGWLVLRRGPISVMINFSDRTVHLDERTESVLFESGAVGHDDGVTLGRYAAAVVRRPC
ncbi:malto-oligosyltrehalose trehalohydrolase [Microlunatus elymi]|uniref:Malto-oligosyltrehalose trehalohydrolase n=1 Tax=Microlunatus elymi TaxID=2596828 RepID=A0A516PWB0_9ACTN|nr:malto-oligosyltrehalose trehalohydrolase [Microlunatus elymi]QDP95467.1 malto-oligosyltrehalose trehalohydrolase [Microlunatus elymi]